MPQRPFPLVAALCLHTLAAAAGGAERRIAGRIVAPAGATELHLHGERPANEVVRAAWLLDGNMPPVEVAEFPLAADGSFEFTTSGAPRFLLVAKAGELRFEREVAGAPGGELETLTIPAAQALAGRVVDPLGKGVGGAVVYLENSLLAIAPWKLAPPRQVTGEDGSFELPYFPESRLVVLARGFPPATWHLARRENAPQEFRLAAAPARKIRVFETLDKGAPGILVSTGQRLPLGFTGADGRLAAALDDQTALVFQVPDGRGRWQLDPPLWQNGELRTLLGGQFFLAGRVEDPGGKPLAGAEVDLLGAGSSGPSLVRSDAQGRWQLGPVSAPWTFRRPHALEPAWHLRFRAAGYAELRADFPLAKSGLVIEIPAQQLEPEAQVSGLVVDPAGNPVAGAGIFAHPATERRSADGLLSREEPRCTTGEDGSFVLGGLTPGGQFTLVAQAGGFLPRLLRGVAAGMAGVELALTPATRVKIRVVDDEGRPVPRVHLQLAPPLPDLAALGADQIAEWVRRREEAVEPFEFQGFTGEDGVALLPAVKRGRLGLEIQESGFLPVKREVEVGEKPLELVERLSRGTTIEGTVVDAEGNRLPDVDLEVESRQLSGYAGSTDDRGDYRLGGLQPGTIAVAASDGSKRAEGTVEVVPGITRYRLDLQLTDELLEVHGILTDAAGAPVAGREVYLHQPSWAPDGSLNGGSWLGVATAADGTFRFRSPHQRTYLLEVYAVGESAGSGAAPLVTQEVVPQAQPLRLVLPP